MIESVESVTKVLATFSLNQAWLNQQIVSTNIANAGTQGFTTLEVDFEAALDSFDSEINRPDVAPEGRGRYADALQHTSIVDTNAPVRLDEQMVELSKLSLRYLSLLSALERYGSIKGIAVRGGGR